MGNAADPPRRPERVQGAGRSTGPTAAEVTERLRHQIQEGLWTPGEWLREPRMCAEFKVGRSIVRRALRNLADDGLVVIEPNRGASVTLTTLQEVFDLYELRAGLYGVAARFACIRASPPLMAEILEKADILLAASEAGAPADELIHQSEVIFSLMAGTASADAQAMIAAVRRKTRWHYSYVGLAESPPGPFDHWRVMRAGLAARDAARAAEGARNILYYMQNEVGRLMLSRGLGMQEPARSLDPRRPAAPAA
ncbi:MAG TPA: GntR family transcriptional regulator [Phenylobacterium sp.]|jgi:DNA-binding GntR family transcriptional regulator|nr:GntR family transcriptional regulator [Phenylobacterium sp.]